MATKIELFSFLVSIFFIVHVAKSTHTYKKKVKLSNKQVGHWSLHSPEKVGLKGRNTTMFRYRTYSAISQDPKLRTQKINLIDMNWTSIILGYKPRAILGLDIYYRLWNLVKIQLKNYTQSRKNECKRLETNKQRDREVMNIKQLRTSLETCLQTSEAFYNKLAHNNGDEFNVILTNQ